jgi:hypothetical protein
METRRPVFASIAFALIATPVWSQSGASEYLAAAPMVARHVTAHAQAFLIAIGGEDIRSDGVGTSAEVGVLVVPPGRYSDGTLSSDEGGAAVSVNRSYHWQRDGTRKWKPFATGGLTALFGGGGGFALFNVGAGFDRRLSAHLAIRLQAQDVFIPFGIGFIAARVGVVLR